MHPIAKSRPSPSPLCLPARGFTLIEIMIAVTVGALLMISLGGVIANALNANDAARTRNQLAGEARLALQRMVQSVQDTSALLIPMVEDSSTGNSESLIDPGVLAVTLNPLLDRDLDGFADADNDGDGLVDEDLPSDSSNDNSPGLVGIDDDNSGIADISFAGAGDDDETGSLFGAGEDPINGLDDDGDGSIDEDPPADMNGDGAPGIALFDDDGDGAIDEGSAEDDDEDGISNEDWLDVVVYFLSGTKLIERFPNLNPTSGTDYTERTIAEHVSQFRVERLPRGSNRVDLVAIALELTNQDVRVTVEQQVRVGGPP